MGSLSGNVTTAKVVEVVSNGSPNLFPADAELEAQIARRILRQTSGRVRNLAVEVRSGAIVLTGRCMTFYTKQLAGHAAMGAIESEELRNQIEVVY